MADFDMPREEGLEDLEEEPRRRPWAVVAIVVLAALLLLAGVQWRRVADRETQLRAELQALQRENETLRLQVNQAQRLTGEMEQKVQALTAERRELAQKVDELERRAGKTRPQVKPTSKR